jgi:hypothetical protein
MTLTYHNGVSIAEVIVYVPALAIAVFLSFRHGFGRSAGWFFLIIFTLARIIGSCMQLATISNPTSASLYTGYSILQNVGLSPLMLATLGLLSRLLESINKAHRTFINTNMLKVVELVIIVALILGIVGGVNASDDFVKTGVYHPGTLSKAGTALFIVCYVAVVIVAIATSFSISHAEEGEKRLLLAIAISLPFLLVRLIYSIMSTFTHNKSFNLLSGNVTVILCVALIEEFIIVVVYEGIGLTLQQVPKEQHVESYAAGHQQIPSSSSSHVPQPKSRAQNAGNTALKIAKMTIIGRLISIMIPDKKNRDVEMQTSDIRK